MGITDFFADVMSALSVTDVHAEAPAAEADDNSSDDAGKSEEPEEEEAADEEEEEEEEEPEDPKPALEEGEWPYCAGISTDDTTTARLIAAAGPSRGRSKRLRMVGMSDVDGSACNWMSMG
jgi:hypothetical protein